MEQFNNLDLVNKTIAENLKNLRKQRKLTLDSVSELTGVSKSMLGQIERSESSPTISTLWKIATGLHISFTSLMEKPHQETIVIKNDEIPPISSDNKHFRLYPIFPLENNRSFEMLYIEIDSGSTSESLPHEFGTEEFIIVYSGSLELTIDNTETYTISEGSSIHYKADKNHKYHNPSNTTTKLCMVIHYKTN